MYLPNKRTSQSERARECYIFRRGEEWIKNTCPFWWNKVSKNDIVRENIPRYMINPFTREASYEYKKKGIFNERFFNIGTKEVFAVLTAAFQWFLVWGVFSKGPADLGWWLPRTAALGIFGLDLKDGHWCKKQSTFSLLAYEARWASHWKWGVFFKNMRQKDIL